ncbi:Conserved domain protein [plant metagenome]|uniref:Conserved domain protein n=1 Tax=plant metagenome TaxID=1297885 RepID=A0A484QZA7_9ZZZZ
MALINLNLLGNQTTRVPQDQPVANGDTLSVNLSGTNTLIIDGVDVDLAGTVSAAVGGDTTIEATNGANVNVTSFAGVGAANSLTYRIGENASLGYGGGTLSVGLLNNTNIEFASGGTGTLSFVAPTANLDLSARPTITGLTAGDKLNVSQGNLIGDPTPASSVSYENGVLTVYRAGPLGTQLPIASFNAPDLPTDGSFSLDADGNVVYACFLRGTLIATPDGETAVEDLREGDRVRTASGGVATVKWVGYRKLHRNRIPAKDALRAYPVRIAKDALADGRPVRDLTVSPGHHLYFDGRLVPAMALINGLTIVQDRERVSFEYFHVELDRFDILLADGVPAESYVDTGNRQMFQNADTVALRPDFGPAAGRPQIEGLTIERSGRYVETLRNQLLVRAQVLTGVRRVAEPDLRLEIAGQRIEPSRVDPASGLYAFDIPATAAGQDVYLVSRSAIVRETSVHVRMDRRRVGVGLASLALLRGEQRQPIDLMDPRLQGFNDPQDAHGTPMRWTMGRSLIPAALLAGEGAATLELRVLRTYSYWETADDATVLAA